MSEEEVRNPEDAEEETDSSEESRSTVGGLMTKLKVGGFIAVIVLSECAAAYLLLPSAEDVKAMAMARVADGDSPIDSDLGDGEDAEPVTEVDLGNYTVTSYQPSSNVTLRIDFRLFGTVLDKDLSRFHNRFDSTENRLRDQVIITVRNSKVNDLTDASLGLLKRQIVETINKTLGGPLVQEVGFGDFSFLEQ